MADYAFLDAYPRHLKRVRNYFLWMVGSKPVTKDCLPFFEALDVQTWNHRPEAPTINVQTEFQFHVLEAEYEVHDSGTVVRAIGVTRSGHDVCVFIHGFNPRFVISYGRGAHLDDATIRLRLNSLEKQLVDHLYQEHVKKGRIAGLDEDVFNKLRTMGRYGFIYNFTSFYGLPILGYHPDEEKQQFISIEVAWPGLVPFFRNFIWDHHKRIEVYEGNIEYTIRFSQDNGLIAQSWYNIKAGTYRNVTDKERKSHCCYELEVGTYKNITVDPNQDMPPYLLSSFDIECKGARGFPVPENDNDLILNIGYSNVQNEKELASGVIVTGDVYPDQMNMDHICVPDQLHLLLAFVYWMLVARMDIITGWNIKNFDLDWIIRKMHHMGLRHMCKLGRIKNNETRVRSTVFETRAAGKHNIKDVSVSGVAVFDLFQVMKRDIPLTKKYQITSFALGAVATAILGETKNEMNYQDIPKLSETTAGRTRLARYVRQDAVLPARMTMKMKTIPSTITQCRVTSVNFQDYAARGVQFKIIGSIMSLAHQTSEHNKLPFLVNTIDQRFKTPTTTYEGATVIEAPAQGIFYDETTPVATLDFASLYPSIMMGYNLCYTTAITKERIVELKLDYERDIHYLPGKDGQPEAPFFVRKHIREGILPRLLKGFVADRKNAKDLGEEATQRAGIAKLLLDTNKTMKQLHDEALDMVPITSNEKKTKKFRLDGIKLLRKEIVTEIPEFDDSYAIELIRELLFVLQVKNLLEAALCDMIQNGKKIICNSVYGFTGVNMGKLPYKIVAEMTTKIGRFLIAFTQKIVNTDVNRKNGYAFDAFVVYGDTDSVFFKCLGIIVPDTITDEKERYFYRAKVVMEHGPAIADMITKRINVSPIKLEFEKVFVTLLFGYKEPKSERARFRREFDGSKKRYAGYLWTDITTEPKVKVMGMEVVRRDGCPLQRIVLDRVLDLIVKQRKIPEAVAYVQDIHHKLYSGQIPFQNLIISKSLAKNPEDYDEESHAEDGVEYVAEQEDNDEDVAFLEAGDIESDNGSDNEEEEEEMEPAPAKAPRTGVSGLAWDDSASKKKRVHKKGKLAHVELAKSMGDTYHSGDRVKYVVVKAGKKAKMYEKARDPVEAIRHRLPLDADYYWFKQLRAPLERIMRPVLAKKEANVLGQLLDPLYGVTKELDKINSQVTMTKAMTSTNSVMNKFLTQHKAGSCVKCHLPLPRETDALCNHCYGDAHQVTIEKIMQRVQYKQEYEDLHRICIKCKGGDPNENIWGCVNSDCKHYFSRVIAKEHLDSNEAVLKKLLDW